MITALNEIEKLQTVVSVTLLSSRGEILYDSSVFSIEYSEKKMILWKALLAILKKPVAAEFVFNNGVYFVSKADLGYIIVNMTNRSEVDAVKNCALGIQTVWNDSGGRKKVLLQMLFRSHDMFKPQIVAELNKIADKEVALNLLKLLQKEKGFYPKVREKLLYAICKVLGQCRSIEAIGPLKRFFTHYKVEKKCSRKVLQTVLVSIKQLQFDKLHSQNAQVKSNNSDVSDAIGSIFQSKENNQPPIASRNENSLAEAEIKKLLEQGQKNDAVAVLMETIEKLSKSRQFNEAERLRDWLMEIDSMLLQEIIRAAEIIEEEKTAAIDPEHTEIWRALAGTLTQEEFASVYHQFENKTYPSGKTVVKQGAFFRELLFVNSGRLTIYTEINNTEITLKTVGPGEIVGTNPFFESSVWTVSARSLGASVFSLSRQGVDELEEKHPSIESKLFDFCALFTSSRKEFKKLHRSRRKYERKKIEGRLNVILIDSSGQSTGVKLKGDVFDLSRGGISFCLNVSKKRNAQALFGERIQVILPSEKRANGMKMNGKVVAVRGHHVVNNEYSVHVQFDDLLSAVDVNSLTWAK